jgi:hypothetical protein
MALVRLAVIASLFGFAGAHFSAAAQSEIQASVPPDRQIHGAQELVPQQPSALR